MTEKVSAEAFRKAVRDFTVEDHAYGQMVATGAATRFEKRGWGGLAGGVWQVIALSQESQMDLDPAAAFDYAVDLVMLDEPDEGCDSPELTLWLQGNGLQQLLDRRMQPYLLEYLNRAGGQQFVAKLKLFLGSPVQFNRIKTKHDLGYLPECFRLFATVLLSLDLLDDGSVPGLNVLKELTKQQLGNQEFMRIVGLYASISDTAVMAAKLIEAAR